MNATPASRACPHCGQTHPIGTKFCPTTGKRISQKCPRCWTHNPPENKFCMECGADLSQAIFGIPQNLAEQWGAAFTKFDWPRTIKSDSLAHDLLQDFEPKLDPSNETIVCRDTIRFDGWFISAKVNGYEISSKREDAGMVIVTSWRIIVLDYVDSRFWGLPYRLLDDISLYNNNGAGSWPYFEIAFGPKWTVRLNRNKLPVMTQKPSGTLSRMLTAPTTQAMLDILFLQEVDQVKNSLERIQAEQKLFVSWFEFVIESRHKFESF